MKQDKKLSSQSYFIYKVTEYLNNDHHVLQDKRFESYLTILEDYIDIQDEINLNQGDESKLYRSLIAAADSVKFYSLHTPLSLHSFLGRDIKTLKKQLDNYPKDDKEESKKLIKDLSIYVSISSLVKKIKSKGSLGLHIDIIQNHTLSFEQVDRLLDSYISDLLYKGYSLKYLNEWYKKIRTEYSDDVSNERYHQLLEEFRSLNSKHENYKVVLKSWLPDELSDEIIRGEPLEIEDFRYESLAEDTFSGIADQVADQKIDNFKKSKGYYLKIELSFFDKFKAIEAARNKLSNYLDMYKYLHSNKKPSAVNPLCLVSNNGDEWELISIESTDDFKVLRDIDEREKEDIKDLVALRNDLLRRADTSDYSNVIILERSLALIKNSTHLSMENRLLNIWSALEYILTAYNQGSIIGKSQKIISKVIALYYIKDKMNILWKEFQQDLKRIPQLNEVISNCSKEEDPGKYDKEKFLSLLGDEEELKKILELYTSKIGVYRRITEIRELIIVIKNTPSKISGVHETIENDLTRIYRLRNKLVHSGANLPENIDIITGRLYRYVNCLIGTLIHYIKRSPSTSITEILFSIVQTYEWYMDYLDNAANKTKKDDKGKVDIKNFASPPYLFL